MENVRKYSKKTIILFLFFLISLILFLFNAKFILEADTNYNAAADVSYITPLSASFEKGGKFPFNLNINQTYYEILLDAKLIKKIRLNVKSEHKDIIVTINKAGIKLPYLPALYFPIQNPCKLTYDNLNIIFSDISVLLIIVPLLLLLISITLFIILFYKYIKRSLSSVKEYNHIFIGMVIFIILFEAVKFTGMYSNSLGSNLTMFLYIFKSDSYFLSIFLILLYTAVKIKSRYISIFIMLIFCTMVFILVLDIAIITLLSARLRFADASGLMPDIASIIKMVKGFFITSVGIYSLVLVIYVILFSIYIVRKKDLYQFSKPYKIVLLAMVIIFAPLFMIKLDVKSYYGTALQDSIITANMPKTEDIPYTHEKIDNILNDFKFKYNCVEGKNSRQNIIVLIIESLSSYKSKFFSGIDDKTPNLDKLAENNIYSLDYYCNSYNSNQNIFNILTASPLITKIKNYETEYKAIYENSIVRDFQKNGYDVEYYSAADTVFDGTAAIVNSSGIDKIYDADSDIFKDIKRRYVFNGIEDEDFYNGVLNHLKSKNMENPYLVFLTTMSTHAPYEDPETGEYSFDKAIQYADEQAGYFVEELKKNGFFDNGILVITSDHRAMLPLTSEEYNVLGRLSHADIPLIIIDNGKNYKLNGSFSHTDLGKSLEYLTLDKVCFNQFQTNMFEPDNQNSCVIYQQLINLALVDIKCGNTYGQVLLDGDNTRFINDNLDITNEEKNDIINYINYLRLVK